mmetsp:Transcript_7697/g.16747  ORF Transcript_7697/g.16747 Transcript_7697/m.16747 type:complete len:212 (-) Transcript_7697:698-1333(-)
MNYNCAYKSIRKGSFAEDGTDKETTISLTGDDIIGDILNSNMALIPITVGQHGTFGSLFQRFIYDIDAIPSPDSPHDRQNAAKADRLARSAKVPRALLPRANDLWRKENPDMFYGDSCKTMDPQLYFEHEVGLVISTAISSHLLQSHNKNRRLKPIRYGVDKECKCTAEICPQITQDSTNIPMTDQAGSISGSDNTFEPDDSVAFTNRYLQ